MKLQNEENNRYGRWTVLNFSHWHEEPSGKRVPYWNCKCDCNVERAVNIRNLRKGKSISCGCYNREITSNRIPAHRQEKGQASCKQLWHAYKQGAQRRNIPYKLTLEEFTKITSSNCTYCGVEPRQINNIKQLYGSYIYNGIDRKDPTKGYIKDNCVPCCKHCNYAKRESTVEEFKEWIQRLIQFQLKS